MKFYIVDCFAEEKYQGNELLVVVADRPVSDEEQQAIAREINFSETTFILSDKKDDGGYDVRIWTPNVGEVPFAGHPTLGTAYVIYKYLEKEQCQEIKLNLKAGQIPVRVTDSGLIMKQNQPEFGITIDKNIIADIYGIEADEIRMGVYRSGSRSDSSERTGQPEEAGVQSGKIQKLYRRISCMQLQSSVLRGHGESYLCSEMLNGRFCGRPCNRKCQWRFGRIFYET